MYIVVIGSTQKPNIQESHTLQKQNNLPQLENNFLVKSWIMTKMWLKLSQSSSADYQCLLWNSNNFPKELQLNTTQHEKISYKCLVNLRLNIYIFVYKLLMIIMFICKPDNSGIHSRNSIGIIGLANKWSDTHLINDNKQGIAFCKKQSVFPPTECSFVIICNCCSQNAWF